MNTEEQFFVEHLLDWYKISKRSFPWRTSHSTPYKILVAELMLKKTRAENVVGPFQEFITKYPTPNSVARAEYEDLRATLAPLGLINQRVKAFKSIFLAIKEKHGGIIPNSRELLLQLPYIGAYTANAVLCFGFGYDVPIVDINVTRVCKRYFGLEVYDDPRVDKHIWELLARITPKGASKEFNYAILDLGSLICKSRNPIHDICPLKRFCKTVAPQL